MEAKELMIGDWCAYGVNCKGRVTALTEHLITLSVDGNEINGLYMLMPDMVRPIPLTEEILVKNGFVGVELTDSYELNTDYYEIEVWNYSDGLWVVNVHWIEFSSTPESKATVSYVHQLQHLLRLCGIEKEISI